MNTVAMLTGRMEAGYTLASCGLDPDLKRIPRELTGTDADRVHQFLSGVVEAAAPHMCAFKAQKAFFDGFEGGHDVLIDIVGKIHSNHPGVPVFVDCKIGDIDNTMGAYVDFLLGEVDADGILVNPYMGDEVLEAFDNYPDRAIIVLARTSNPGASIVQDALMADGRSLWQYILELVVKRWNKNGNLIPVIASTAGLNLAETRQMIPDQMPILLAGVGAQGGDYTDLQTLLNKSGAGVFVNSSRGILYPSNPGESWQAAVAQAAADFKNSLNQVR